MKKWHRIKWHTRVFFEYVVVILVMVYVILAKLLGKRFYTTADIPKLANIKKREPYDIYIGRANGYLKLEESIWNNKYVIGVDGDRATCVEKHMADLRANKKLLRKLKTLSGKTLGCYCYSSTTKNGVKCHGHNIIQLYKEKILKK